MTIEKKLERAQKKEGRIAKQLIKKRTAELMKVEDISIDEIYQKRYYLDWDNKDLNAKVLEMFMSDHSTTADLKFFINWKEWTRSAAGKEMSAEFFHKNVENIDLVYVFKHDREFRYITENDLVQEYNRYQIRRSHGTVVRVTREADGGLTIGIPFNVINQQKFADEMMAIVDAEKNDTKQPTIGFHLADLEAACE